MSPALHSRGRRLALSASWLLACGLGSTVLLTMSHQGAGILLGPLRADTLRQALLAAQGCAAALAATLALLLVVAWLQPALKAAAQRVAMLCAGLLVSGLPAAMFTLGLTNWYGGDFRHWASGTGLIGFVLWVRTLTEAWRGTLLAWRS